MHGTASATNTGIPVGAIRPFTSAPLSLPQTIPHIEADFSAVSLGTDAKAEAANHFATLSPPASGTMPDVPFQSAPASIQHSATVLGGINNNGIRLS